MITLAASRTHFIADPHFYHSNIIKYCERPFKDKLDMNRSIIANWNEHVKKGDTVIVLGDLLFGGVKRVKEILDQINGDIIWVPGNHDYKPFTAEHEKIIHKVPIDTILKVKILDPEMAGGEQIILCLHYPIARWENRDKGWWMFHGHTHGSFINQGPSIDCGIDATKRWRPSSYEEMKIDLYKKTTTPNFAYGN